MADRRYRILTVADVPRDPDGGASGTVYHTNVALRGLGHEVDEIWSHDLGPRRIRHGNLHSLLEQPRAYRRAVMCALQRKPYDVVMMSQPQAYLAARSLKKASFGGLVVNRSHGLELRANAVLPQWHRKLGVPISRAPRITSFLTRLLERQWPAVVRSSDGIIVPCEMDRDFLLRRVDVDPSRVRTIHHGVSRDFVEMPLTEMTAERRRKLLYVGQHAFIKGPHLLLKIVNAVLSATPDVLMTWVTPAQAHEWIRGGLTKEVRTRVTLLDWMSQDQLRRVYDDHGIFVFPSFFEGAGKAALEAYTRGLYIVASDTGGMRDYFENDQRSTLCRIGDLDSFVFGIRRALAEHEGKNIAKCKSTHSDSCRTWRPCAECLISFFEHLRSFRCIKPL